MTTATTSYDQQVTPAISRQRLLRKLIAGAAVFDGAMGIVCLVAAPDLGGWLSLGTSAVRTTGVVFLVAGAVGAQTARSTALDVRWIAAATRGFAAWCVALLAAGDPGTLGVALLAASVVASIGTAVTE